VNFRKFWRSLEDFVILYRHMPILLPCAKNIGMCPILLAHAYNIGRPYCLYIVYIDKNVYIERYWRGLGLKNGENPPISFKSFLFLEKLEISKFSLEI